MRDIWTLDAETDPFKYGRIPAPFIWGAYNGSEYHQFDTVAEVVAFVKEIDGIFYAHNGGRFDYHFLIPHAEAYDDLLVIHGRIAKWRLGKAEMRDSFNILPVALATYKKDEIDYSIMEPGERDKPANRAKIEGYLRSDCVYLWELVTQFVERYGLSLTQAAASMRQWKKFSGIDVRDSGSVFFDKFKPFYFGGRVQAFQHGYKRERCYSADVNSAYPAAMLHDHPFGTVVDTAPRSKVKIRGRDFYVVHGVTRGCFPYREGLTLAFPDDGNARTYHVTGHELQAAVETGGLRPGWEIVERIAFVESVNFKDYILFCYEQRAEAKARGDKAGALFWKLLMNSLYGKFGADPRKYVNHFLVPAEIVPVNDASYPLAGYVGPWALVENLEKPTNSRFYNVATAASITGFQRAVLIRQIPKAKGLIYCDTDNIKARDLGAIDLGAGLGAWSLEIDEASGQDHFDWWAVAGRKLYAFGMDNGFVKYASKGAKLYPAEIVKVAKGGMVKYLPDVPTFSVIKPPGFVEREIRLTR